MAKSTTGKWVSRVGASGGGKTYRKNRPMNYYGILGLITIVGLLTVVYSRYQYQNPASEIPPVIGQTWYASLSVQVCGDTLPYLPKDERVALQGFNVLEKNVLGLTPQIEEEAGKNATFGKFLEEHAQLTVTANTLKWPEGVSYTNGDKCPAGSQYAGKPGHVEIAYWSTLSQPEPTITTDPAALRFSDQMQISVGFVPDNVHPTNPPSETLAYMVTLGNQNAVTTTTVGP